MQKVKTLSAFLLIYLAVGALTFFIVSVIYGEPFYSFYKVINATALLTFFFYVSIYRTFEKHRLFDVHLDFSLHTALAFFKGVRKWLLLYFKNVGVIEFFYILHLSCHSYLENTIGCSLDDDVAFYIYRLHRGFWFFLAVYLLIATPRTVAFMLVRKKVTDKYSLLRR